MNLKTRWAQLMSDLGLKENVETYESLIAAYSEPHRHYHNINHLQMVLKQFERVEQLAKNKSHIKLALWFHDAVYKPFSSTNEKDSAKWASEFLINNGVAQAVANSVARLVMATSHNRELCSGDEKIIVDVDLAVLGQPKKEYEKYSKGIRQEYKLVPLFIYKNKRRALLKGFIEKEQIYSCEAFNHSFEAKARRKLLAEIESL